MNPPFSMLDRVLLKCVTDEVENVVMVVPQWEGRPFLDMFYKMAVSVKKFNVGGHFFELHDGCNVHCAGSLRWNVFAGFLSFKFYVASLRAGKVPPQPDAQ